MSSKQADRDHLFVDESSDHYRIAWWLVDDQDIGGTLGDGDRTYTAQDLTKAKPEERQHIIACRTAEISLRVERDDHGFRWPTLRTAIAALKLINIAIKADSGGPWPEWALKAKAEGWQPPKGWKPS